MLAALCAFAAMPARADSVSTETEGGFGRIVFTFDPAAHATAQLTSGVVTVTASRRMAIDPAQIARNFGAYVSNARLDPNGITLRIALAQDVRLHTSVSANRFGVDLVPATFPGLPANLPPPPPKVASAVDVAKLPPLAIRSGAYANFSRIVFDWTKEVRYAITPATGHLLIRFEAQARPDFTAFQRIAPPWVKLATWRVENGGTVIEFTADPGSRYHDFRDGAHVVLDILSPKTDADAYKPPGDKGGVQVKSLTASNAPAAKANANTPDAAKAAAAAQALIDSQNKPQTAAAAASPAQPDAQTP